MVRSIFESRNYFEAAAKEEVLWLFPVALSLSQATVMDAVGDKAGSVAANSQG